MWAEAWDASAVAGRMCCVWMWCFPGKVGRVSQLNNPDTDPDRHLHFQAWRGFGATETCVSFRSELEVSRVRLIEEKNGFYFVCSSALTMSGSTLYPFKKQNCCCNSDPKKEILSKQRLVLVFIYGLSDLVGK